MPTAARVAAELKETLGIEAAVVAGGKGVFDVLVDDKLLYSKHLTARFPDQGEVSRLIQSRA